jgi:predicted 2-oxoglutarate/Fe(II)-dependent dioxygenase YbiX/peroxiredoxin
VLCFFASAAERGVRRMLDELWSRQDVFDDHNAALFGVSCDPGDEAHDRVREKLPGFRVFWDFDLKVATAYGLLRRGTANPVARVEATTYVLDAALRVVAVLPLRNPANHAAEIVAAVTALWRREACELEQQTAPILLVPRVFEPEFCRRLIDLYSAKGGVDSGFMQEVAGRTVGVVDHGVKRRRDREIENEALRLQIRTRLQRRLSPEIERTFCYRPTRIERYIVACYDADEGGHFRAHRDNTTSGTAHRRFAVTVNLNAEDYEGGDLRFPEYGPRLYRAPTGGAIMFSCSLMHEATMVTRGRRFAFLPFLYDEASAKVRLANVEHLADPALREAVRSAMG